ncbi:butyrophilin-like protein 2 [Centropristis striata]|uniref:butyrophilin-like protein 2 n=1 Tax=Centropristis striata TaxID=184440 RepID=UPI0027E144E8|nr:butyrophilin-like protein 2 [Centropristis striata]
MLSCYKQLWKNILFLIITVSSSGQSQMVGSSQPILATIGADITLPCHLVPPANVAAKTLEWARFDLNPRFVHVRRDGIELLIQQNPSYVGRTSLSTDKLKYGDISLKLSRVKLSDAGRYRCHVPSLGTSEFNLTVGSVSSPVVEISKVSSGVLLVCKSVGWYPEPEVLWLDGEGKLLSAGPTETVRGPDDLYTVSSRVTVERHSSSFICRVHQRDTKQIRETEILIKEDVFMHPPSAVVRIVLVLSVYDETGEQEQLLKERTKGLDEKLLQEKEEERQSNLICSSQPIITLAGGDVILPCRIDPPMSASFMPVQWTRPGLDPEYIHLRQDGHMVYQSQNPQFKYRTALFLDQLINGNVSLRLSRVKVSDAGKYRCFIPTLWKEAFIQVTVGAASSPSISSGRTDTGVLLVCKSAGWYPEPEVLWLDGEGKLLSAGPTETVRGPDDLYTVSSRVTVERHSSSFTCRVHQKDTKQIRETHITVPEDVFMHPPSAAVRIVLDDGTGEEEQLLEGRMDTKGLDKKLLQEKEGELSKLHRGQPPHD